MTTLPCSKASAYRSRNSVGVSSHERPSTYACTLRGSTEKLLDLDRVAAALLLAANPPPGGRANAGHELLHRKRLHEVIVRPDLERMDPVVLRSPAPTPRRSACRCPPARAVSINFQPSKPGNIRSSTHTSGRSNRSRANPASPFATQSGSNPASQMARHPLRDHLIILNDQHLRHAPPSLRPNAGARGLPVVTNGERLVTPLHRVRRPLGSAGGSGPRRTGLAEVFASRPPTRPHLVRRPDRPPRLLRTRVRCRPPLADRRSYARPRRARASSSRARRAARSASASVRCAPGYAERRARVARLHAAERDPHDRLRGGCRPLRKRRARVAPRPRDRRRGGRRARRLEHGPLTHPRRAPAGHRAGRGCGRARLGELRRAGRRHRRRGAVGLLFLDRSVDADDGTRLPLGDRRVGVACLVSFAALLGALPLLARATAIMGWTFSTASTAQEPSSSAAAMWCCHSSRPRSSSRAG